MPRTTTVTVCLLLCGLLLACGGKLDVKPNAGGQADGKAKPRPREELQTLLTGKTKDEVIKAMGRPERTNDILGTETWTYHEASFDPVSQKTDHRMTLWFDNGGRVERVKF